MGRFVSGAGGSVPRKQTVRLTASNPSVAIPSWARMAYITGVAPGGGGGNCNSGTSRGGGGGTGAYAIRCPLQITNETTLGVVIGAIGMGAPPNSNAAGNNGGNTTVTLGSTILTLEGGRGGSGNTNAQGGPGGRAWLEQVGNVNGRDNVGNAADLVGIFAPPSPLGSGQPGGNASSGGVLGGGAGGPFGAGGPNVNSSTTNTPGGNAVGFGSSGAGANGSGTAGNGAPSFILIEFEEAL